MPGEIGEWHENPMPQWIMPRRGRWRVETMDGVIVDMGPGDISFGGDQELITELDIALGQKEKPLLSFY